jgi:hypothetical protein
MPGKTVAQKLLIKEGYVVLLIDPPVGYLPGHSHKNIEHQKYALAWATGWVAFARADLLGF